MDPGKTAISPPCSTEPDPEGILISMEGGESSEMIELPNEMLCK